MAGHGLMHNAALGNAHRADSGLERAQKSHRRLSRCFIARNWLLHSFHGVSRHRALEWDLRKASLTQASNLLPAAPPSVAVFLPSPSSRSCVFGRLRFVPLPSRSPVKIHFRDSAPGAGGFVG